MEPGPPHQYQPLQSAKHIRIIILEPSIDPTSPLVFSFDQDNLTNLAGQYEALSYTWGVPNLVLPLHCLDGSQVCVTENLDRFLRRLRLKIDKKWLWADAACINQADGAEKAVQIPLMVDIFRGAKGVLAWLGSGENGGEEAVRRLVQLSRCNVNSSVQDSVDQGMSFDSADFKTTMSVLINLPWFKRMWIIQEVVFNQDVTLICGTAEMSWVRFFASLNAFKRLLGDHYVFDHIQRIVSLWLRHSIVHELQHSAHEEGIMELMTTFGQYHCSDERDRIYALFSLATDVGENSSRSISSIPMKIDYQLDIRETYRAFAEAAMCNGHSFKILNASSTRQMVLNTSSWPSWVPDWRRPTIVRPKLSPDFAAYGASFEPKLANMELQIDIRKDRASIHIRDVSSAFYTSGPLNQLVKITKGPEYPSKSDKDQCYAYFSSILKFFREFSCRGPSVSDQSLLHALGRMWEHEIGVSSQFIHRTLKELGRAGYIQGGDNHKFYTAGKTLDGLCIFSASPSHNNHYFGLGSRNIQSGDKMAVMTAYNANFDYEHPPTFLALILRPTRTEDFRFVGTAHVVAYKRGKRCTDKSNSCQDERNRSLPSVDKNRGDDIHCGFPSNLDGYRGGRIKDSTFTLV